MSNSSPVYITPELKRRQLWVQSVILVPYGQYHVPKYNQWMRDAELQYLTGSEPLTLEEEYNMFQSWCEDPNKCTFIVLDRAKFESLSHIEDKFQREIDSMVGDVNFYVHDQIETVAEIEVMIAEVAARGRGLGYEAVLAMMKFGHEMAHIARFEAKIKMDNFRSQRLFVEKFAFVESSRSDIFQEVTFQSDLSPGSTLKLLLQQTVLECHCLDSPTILNSVPSG